MASVRQSRADAKPPSPKKRPDTDDGPARASARSVMIQRVTTVRRNNSAPSLLVSRDPIGARHAAVLASERRKVKNNPSKPNSRIQSSFEGEGLWTNTATGAIGVDSDRIVSHSTYPALQTGDTPEKEATPYQSNTANIAAKASTRKQKEGACTANTHTAQSRPRPLHSTVLSRRIFETHAMAAAKLVASTSPMPAITPISNQHNEDNFEVISSRVVFPITSKHPPLYQLPQAASSEPTLSSRSTERLYLPGDSSDSSSPPRGHLETCALSSMKSHLLSDGTSAASDDCSSSLEDERVSLSLSPRRRPVHLKTTLREVKLSKRDSDRDRNGTDAVNESEKKRYESVWAANCQETVGTRATGTMYVHDLVVRELWNRSNLSADVLQHIWYAIPAVF
jgi:hypothetical protein